MSVGPGPRLLGQLHPPIPGYFLKLTHYRNLRKLDTSLIRSRMGGLDFKPSHSALETRAA